MSCQFCGHENPAGARFCNDCGAHLAAPTITPEPRSYTPRHLVEKILASQSALRGERKLVTVLFADVVRSMELAERVDPACPAEHDRNFLGAALERGVDAGSFLSGRSPAPILRSNPSVRRDLHADEAKIGQGPSELPIL